ncbi:hypothetical protein PS691_00963 [Pseudomonas fluorescens]|uniref:Uncharacterized protein n=1 Tax=Pseudomonas fluorescens TaxID=294 RepID=A0A5E7AL61_PSEFL|nr:hypothetical protein PS691_00963 [Pseudomonas fluorescens]
MRVILSFDLTGGINFHQQVFIYFQPTINGVNKKWELSFSVCVRVCRALYLPLGKLNSTFSEYISCLLYIHITREFHGNINLLLQLSRRNTLSLIIS